MLNQSPYNLQPTDKAPNVITVWKLLSDVNERKATGLDRIPCKLLQLAGDIVGPSLTRIFKGSIDTGIFPSGMESSKSNLNLQKGC